MTNKYRQWHNGPKASNFIDPALSEPMSFSQLGQTPAWFCLAKGKKYIQKQIYLACNNFY